MLEDGNFTMEVPIIKAEVDEDLGLGVIYMIASQAEVEDTQGDNITTNELRKGAHKFIKDYRKADMDHDWGDHGDVVESLVFDAEIIKAVKEGKIQEGMWIIGVSPHDMDVAKSARLGEIAGASIGGFAIRENGGWLIMAVVKKFGYKANFIRQER